MSRFAKVRFEDDEYEMLQRMAGTMNQSLSFLIKTSTLLWIAYTSQPLINVLNSDEYKDIISAFMKDMENNRQDHTS